MLGLLRTLGYCLLAAVFPVASWPGVRALPGGLRALLHALFVLGALVGLYLLDAATHFSRVLAKVPFLALNNLWLPLFFLVIYALAWIIWWLWWLLAAEPERPEFPDIDAAWAEAVATLAAAGLSLGDLPVFLVLGRTEGPEEGLFEAAQDVQWVVKQAPRPAAPVHVWANRDAVYVTCPGACLLGRLAANLALDEQGALREVGGDLSLDQDDFAVQTIIPRGKGKKVIKHVNEALEEALRLGAKPPGLLKRALRRKAGAPLRKLMANRVEVELLTARLDYFCRLLVRDRQPYCPVNGLLLVLPFGGTDTDDEAQETIGACQRDLATAREVLRVNCPLFVLVCDMETVPGFQELIMGRTREERQQRFGQRFPLATDLAGEALLTEIKKSLDAMCTKLYQEWVYSQFRLEQPDKDSMADAVAVNTRLFDLLNEMYRRRKHFSRVVGGALSAVQGEGPLLYGGCYNAGTGTERGTAQAFVGGVLVRLTKSQNYVSWTDAALAEDARDHRVASLGHVLLGGLWLAVLAVAGYLLFGPGRGRPGRP